MYVQSDPKQGGKGEIYAIDAHHYQHLSGPTWAKRQEEGAKAWPAHPLVVLHRCSSRKPLPT